MDLEPILNEIANDPTMQDTLDAMVADAKNDEATSLNNAGAFHQLVYLINVGVLPEDIAAIKERLT